MSSFDEALQVLQQTLGRELQDRHGQWTTTEVAAYVEPLRQAHQADVDRLRLELSDARAMLRTLVVAASNTALNLNGGIGEGDKVMERMRETLMGVLSKVAPDWAYLSDAAVSLEDYDKAREVES